MPKKAFANNTEDTGALIQAYDAQIQDYRASLGTLTIKDMIMEFGGDKNALARVLAGVSETGTIASMSKKEQSAYRTQAKNIDRWLAYERGERGKQARDITSNRAKASQEKIKDVFARRNPPTGEISATITGWIGYNGDWRHRTISIPAIGKSVDSEKFHAAMQAGDTRAAYQELFNAYAPSITVAQADEFDLQFH